MREMVGGCCVCSDDRGWSENPLVYCDGQTCTVAVHQACYGIVTVPTGPWYCRKCESQERSVKVKCELCPSKYGALKKTDNSGWAHVVCALYIPEVRFGNVTTMEPIQLQLIPAERFSKICYICEEKGKASSAAVGACMQCNKAGCKQQFHVTCAQGLGLLCEEAGNYLDNVKYCGYCQHHYSKLKKGGNVKTIPPYKPVSESHLSDSNSEKELETGSTASKSSSLASSGKRKVSSGKVSSAKTSNSTAKLAHQKVINNKPTDKSKVSSFSATKGTKSEDSNLDSIVENKTDIKDSKLDTIEQNKLEIKDTKGSKKRKSNSRTPTPVTLVSEVSVVVSSISANIEPSSSGNLTETLAVSEVTVTDKPKKPKIETTQSILTNQPVVALTSISTIKPPPEDSERSFSLDTPSIQTPVLPTTQSNTQVSEATTVNSLVVSVPLISTSLSSHSTIVTNQISVLTTTTTTSTTVSPQDRSVVPEKPTATTRDTTVGMVMTGGVTTQNTTGMITSEMSGGGLKITYEKQDGMTEVDMEIEVSPSTQELPSRRGRSQSQDKGDRVIRGKKRSNGSNGVSPHSNTSVNSATKRSSRSQHSTPPPQQGAFSNLLHSSQIKESPPSSPSSESQSGMLSGRSRTKGRKSAPASVSTSTNKDNKDIKLFQNGPTAPHMLGNQLNPTSNMAQKMTDHLNSELEAHSIFNPNDNVNLVGPQLYHKIITSTRASSTGGSSTASGGSGLSSMLGSGGGTIPQTLDQLLERQWEQGSQFLMEQAQHFDIASLLSCLHQLRAENLRLEEHVSSLLQRRDHLLAVNARLAIPLVGQPAAAQSTHCHTVNNIHPSVTTNHADISRSRLPSNNSGYPPHQNLPPHSTPIENGLPPESYARRSPARSQQSPTVRH